MIALNRVKKTRGGDIVLFSTHNPKGTPGMRILAVVMDYVGGEVSADYFYENGQYNKLSTTGYDLIEEIEQPSVSLDSSEEVGVLGGEAGIASSKGYRGSYEDLQATFDVLETAYQALGVLLRERRG